MIGPMGLVSIDEDDAAADADANFLMSSMAVRRGSIESAHGGAPMMGGGGGARAPPRSVRLRASRLPQNVREMLDADGDGPVLQPSSSSFSFFRTRAIASNTSFARDGVFFFSRLPFGVDEEKLAPFSAREVRDRPSCACARFLQLQLQLLAITV